MKHLSLFFLTLAFFPLTAQTYHFEWAKQISGTSATRPQKVATDPQGNLYTSGYYAGTCDFDPGSGTYPLTAGINRTSIFVQKLDRFGNLVWARSTQGVGGIYAWDMALDAAGNNYSVGGFYKEIDFDPGAGVMNMDGGDSVDIFIQKWNAGGQMLWARKFGGIGTDYGQSVATDLSGNVYATGYFKYVGDFDPGTGTTNLNSAGAQDVFVVKLDPGGNLLWAHRFGAAADDSGEAITVDAQGNVYVTGFFNKTVDFDPSASIYELTADSAVNTFCLKLDTDGNFVWGRQLKSKDYNSGSTIAVDSEDGLYIGGGFWKTVNFDPGTDTLLIEATGLSDGYLLKLSSTDGTFKWVHNLGGSAQDGVADLAIDGQGHIYVGGGHGGGTDFDPGPAFEIPNFAGFSDLFLVKYDRDGHYFWSASTGGNSYDAITGIAVSNTGSVYGTGIYRDGADFDPGPEIFWMDGQPFPNYNGFLLKLNQSADFHGKVFLDGNGNLQQDPGELGLPGLILHAHQSNLYASTDSSGFYHIYGEILEDTLTLTLPHSYWSVEPAFAVPDSLQTPMDFALSAPPGALDVAITAIANGPFRPGFETEVIIRVDNYSLSPLDSIHIRIDSFDLDVPLQYVSALPLDGVILGHSIYWTLPAPPYSGHSDIRLRLRTPQTVQTGTPLSFTANVPLSGDLDPANNVFKLNASVIGSYDPNDKQVWPGQLLPTQLDSAELLYVIRFQNTGNYQADRVVIIDTLPSGLNLASLKVLSASHPYSWRLYGNRMLEVRFDPIFLPDSSANEPASHGFVAFSVRPEPWLTVGDGVYNRAAIYFDFNDPIVTAPAVLRMVSVLAVKEAQTGLQDLEIWPNPVKRYDAFAIQWTVGVPIEALVVTDMQGRVCQRVIPSAGTQTAWLSGLPPGVYGVRVSARGELYGRLIVVE